MVSVQIKMMIAMDQDEKKYVGNFIYLGNYNDNGEGKEDKDYVKYTDQNDDDGSRQQGLCLV